MRIKYWTRSYFLLLFCRVFSALETLHPDSAIPWLLLSSPTEAPHCGLHSSVVINLTSFTSYSTVQCYSLFLSLWLGVLHSMHTAEYVHLSLGLLEGVVLISWYNFQLNNRRQLSAFWIVSILKFTNFLTLYNNGITWMPSIVIYTQFCSFHLWDLFWLFGLDQGVTTCLISLSHICCMCVVVWLGPQSLGSDRRPWEVRGLHSLNCMKTQFEAAFWYFLIFFCRISLAKDWSCLMYFCIFSTRSRHTVHTKWTCAACFKELLWNSHSSEHLLVHAPFINLSSWTHGTLGLLGYMTLLIFIDFIDANIRAKTRM